MRTDLLLDRFDTLIRTPEDLAGLESAILDLAVRGHLVPQDPSDEPATTLLKQIKPNKKRFPPIKSDEIPFELPGNWAWARLGEVFELEYGKSLPKKKRDSDGEVPVYGSNGVIGHHSKALVDTHCIVVGRKGSSGAVNLAGEPCWVIDTAFFVRPPDGVDLAFSFHLLRSLRLETLGKGIKPGLNRNEAYNLTVALPPLAEQKRIVARVDELLAQTRALAAQLEAVDEALVPAAQASFQALTNAPDKDLQREAWQRISEAFDALTADPRTLDALKQTVLQLAVQGKLVPQDPNDESARVLLRRIERRKAQLVRDKKLRKSKRVPQIGPDETPFPLPRGWEWSRLAEVAHDVQYGYTAAADSSLEDFRLLRITDIQDNTVRWEDVPGCEIDEDRAQKYLLKRGDILIARTGGTIGKSYLVRESPAKAVFASYLIRVVPSPELDAHYLKLVLESPLYWEQLTQSSKGTGQPNVNATSLGQLMLALPPVTEQKRIVAQVESLLALCDALAAEVVAAEEVRGRLLQAVLNGG